MPLKISRDTPSFMGSASKRIRGKLSKASRRSLSLSMQSGDDSFTLSSNNSRNFARRRNTFKKNASFSIEDVENITKTSRKSRMGSMSSSTCSTVSLEDDWSNASLRSGSLGGSSASLWEFGDCSFRPADSASGFADDDLVDLDVNYATEDDDHEEDKLSTKRKKKGQAQKFADARYDTFGKNLQIINGRVQLFTRNIEVIGGLLTGRRVLA